ncbi:MAG: hypothetical protein WBF38_02750 [Nitrosotalea sp.]
MKTSKQTKIVDDTDLEEYGRSGRNLRTKLRKLLMRRELPPDFF